MSTETISGDPLRVQAWSEYVGQDNLKAQLDVHIDAAVADNRMLDHVLLAAPPGYGKTTLSRIIAREVGDSFQALTMPVKPAVFASFLRQWPGGVLLMDEIHRSSKREQEDFLTLLEDYYYQLPNGGRIDKPSLTIIGATTEPEKIIPPLYDRFTIKPRFTEYSDEEMTKIIAGMAVKAKVSITDDLCSELAKATGGTPRLAKRLVLASRDLSSAGKSVNLGSVLSLCGLDNDGLTLEHIAILTALKELGGQAGMDRLCNIVRMNPSIIADLERLLLKKQLIQFTSGGRELTTLGHRKLVGDARPERRSMRVIEGAQAQ